MTFKPEQVQALEAKLDKANVKGRSQAGRTVNYIEGWHAIAEANRIFGFDAWTRETVEIRQVAEAAREIGSQKKPGWGVSYVARVRITVDGVVREGVGAGHGIDVDLGQAHESAIKEAETDAMKRALMTFGNPFGLALYDKDQTNVETVGSAAETAAINAVNACKSRDEILTLANRDKEQLAALPNGGADRVRARINERLHVEFPKPKQDAA